MTDLDTRFLSGSLIVTSKLLQYATVLRSQRGDEARQCDTGDWYHATASLASVTDGLNTKHFPQAASQ